MPRRVYAEPNALTRSRSHHPLASFLRGHLLPFSCYLPPLLFPFPFPNPHLPLPHPFPSSSSSPFLLHAFRLTKPCPRIVYVSFSPHLSYFPSLTFSQPLLRTPDLPHHPDVIFLPFVLS